MFSRTINYLNAHYILTPTQYGFRSNYSTTHAVLNIVSTYYNNIESKNYSALVLLDQAKALDTINHKILLNKLDNYGMRGVVNQFFLSFLSHRTQYVSFNNCSSSLADIEIDIPHGSSLGLLLFLLYINDLPNSVQNRPGLFADDTCLLINESTPEKLQIELNKDIISVYNWMNCNKLTFNTSKSQIKIL